MPRILRLTGSEFTAGLFSGDSSFTLRIRFAGWPRLCVAVRFVSGASGPLGHTLKTYGRALPANHVLCKADSGPDLKSAALLTELVRLLPGKRVVKRAGRGSSDWKAASAQPQPGHLVVDGLLRDTEMPGG